MKTQISDAELLDILLEVTGWDEFSIRRQLLEDRSFNLLKLDQLKRLIKCLQKKGLNVNSGGNKADLVRNISNILQVKTISTQESESSSSNIAQPPRIPLVIRKTTNNSAATLTLSEKAIVNDLFQFEGLTKDEILEALFQLPSSDRNTDSVLSSILTKRTQQNSTSSLNLPSTKEQEDAELDRAILESEKERENIQDRKRRRIDNILNDCTVSICSTEEFSKSVLLHGLPISLSSNSPEYVHGSKILLGISEVLDQFFLTKLVPLKNTVTIIDLVSEPPQLNEKLRHSVVELLLIEATVLKYYGEASYPFLVYEIEFIDRNLSNLLPSLGNDFDIQLQKIHDKENSIINFLGIEKNKIERGLAKLVKDGEAIPTMLRKKSLLPYYNAVQHCLDKDGFEVVNNTANIKFVDDISESESEDSNEDEYDTE